MKLRRQGIDQKHQHEEIKGIQRPPQETGSHRMPLIRPRKRSLTTRLSCAHSIFLHENDNPCHPRRSEAPLYFALIGKTTRRPILARSVREGGIQKLPRAWDFRPSGKSPRVRYGTRSHTIVPSRTPFPDASPIPLNSPHFLFTIPSKPLPGKDLLVDKPFKLPDTPYSIRPNRE